MWDTTDVDRSVHRMNQESEGRCCGIPHLAKNERDMGHPAFVWEPGDSKRQFSRTLLCGPIKAAPDTKHHALAIETQRQQTGREVNDKLNDLGQTLDAFPLGHIGLIRICPNQVAPCKKLNFYLTCIGAFATVVASRKISGKRATYAIVWSPLYFSPNSLFSFFFRCRIHRAASKRRPAKEVSSFVTTPSNTNYVKRDQTVVEVS
jgi:hypothetical protein